jgi:hypothetical protein
MLRAYTYMGSVAPHQLARMTASDASDWSRHSARYGEALHAEIRVGTSHRLIPVIGMWAVGEPFFDDRIEIRLSQEVRADVKR